MSLLLYSKAAKQAAAKAAKTVLNYFCLDKAAREGFWLGAISSDSLAFGPLPLGSLVSNFSLRLGTLA